MAFAISFGFTWFLIVPRDGEAALISVITGLALHSKIAFFRLIFGCFVDCCGLVVSAVNCLCGIHCQRIKKITHILLPTPQASASFHLTL